MTTHHASITLAQLRAWAGEAVFTRGENYARRGQVRELAATPDGRLVAWVQGNQRYATRVSLPPAPLASVCTCPYGDTCKHAVAVALAYLNRPEPTKPLPVASATDRRLLLLDRQAALAAAQTAGADEQALKSFLAAHTQAELVTLLLDLAQRFPEVNDALAVRQMLTHGNAAQLEADLLARIIDLSAEPDWYSDEEGEVDASDYGPVRDGLRRLLDQGHADAVVRLGEHLLEVGFSQVEQSYDEGEMAFAITECLAVVFRALPSSSRDPAAQIRWAIDARLRDQFDLCKGAQAILERPYPAGAWSQVADELLERLVGLPMSAGNYSHQVEREQLTDYAIMALDAAGRAEEIIPLCVREAQGGNGFVRLFERLLAAGRSAEAEQWARTGIAATATQYPGIANALRERLCTRRGAAGDWMMVAALRAEAFFTSPSLSTLSAVEAAAARAGVAPAVEAALLHYLETGQLPQPKARLVNGVNIPPWPLPATGIAPIPPRVQLRFPLVGLLIERAIRNEQPAEARHWYDRRGTRGDAYVSEDRIADAVVRAYPERAAAIWQQLAEAQIALTTPAAYGQAAQFLRKLRQLWTAQGKTAEWRCYVEALRGTNKRKRRLLETLDALLRDQA